MAHTNSSKTPQCTSATSTFVAEALNLLTYVQLFQKTNEVNVMGYTGLTYSY